MSIRLEDVTFVDSTSKQNILRPTALQFTEGEVTLLLGKTGSGKSTLLRVIGGLEKPTTGTVLYDSESLWTRKGLNPSLLLDVGFVFQYPEHQLFASTVTREFEYSLKPYGVSKEEISARIQFQLEKFGFDKDVRANPLLMSTGQKRRIALASTFSTNPRWLLLDEPSAGLDSMSTRQLVTQIMEQKTKAGSGCGIIIATHDLDAFLPICNRIIILDRGQVAFSGTRDELYTDPTVLEEFGVGYSESLRVRMMFERKGFHLQHTDHDPKQVARTVLSQLTTNMPLLEVGRKMLTVQGTVGNTAIDDANELRGALSERDPRAKWLLYSLLSIGTLLQGRLVGLTIATVLTCILLFSTTGTFRKVRRFSVPFLIFTVLSLFVAGIRFGHVEPLIHVGHVGFSYQAASITFTSLYRIYLLILLSVWFTTTTSSLQIKHGLQQVLKPLRSSKLPVEAVALGTSLILRFIPLITKEVERFQLIARARGKNTRKGIRLQDVPIVAIPLLLSLFQLGEDISTSMEARGYKSFGMVRTESVRLQMNRCDWLVTGLGVLGFLLLLICKHL